MKPSVIVLCALTLAITTCTSTALPLDGLKSLELTTIVNPTMQTAFGTVLAALAEVQDEQARTNKKLAAAQAEIDSLKAAQRRFEGRRQMAEEVPPSPPPSSPPTRTGGAKDDEPMRVFLRAMTTSDFLGPHGGFGGDTMSKSGDGNHRRVQQQSRTCGSADLPPRLSALQAVCCNEPSEDCSSGFPATCNEGCAAAMSAFWTDCQTPFVTKSSPDVTAKMRAAVKLCKRAASRKQSLSQAELFGLTCTDKAQTPQTCVPKCQASTHGYALLATINGDDSSFSCRLANGLYSWMGIGTFLGTDVATFIGSIISGVQGAYFLHVEENSASVEALVTVQPGQVVRIAGDTGVAADGGPASPTWGSGSFVAKDDSELELSNLLLQDGATITFNGNGTTISLYSMSLPSSVLTSLVESIASTSGTLLKLHDVDGRTGTIAPDGSGGWTTTGLTKMFVVTSHYTVTQPYKSHMSSHCTTSKGGRCVGRRYKDGHSVGPSNYASTGWPSASLYHSGFAEQCNIVVLGEGTLSTPPVFDTVSYDPKLVGNPRYKRGHAGQRDILGLKGAACWGCLKGSGPGTGGGNRQGDGNGSGKGGRFHRPGYGGCKTFSKVAVGRTSGPRPAGCYTGQAGPPKGTQLAAGDTLTWKAWGDEYKAYQTSQIYGGSKDNKASPHEGWEICFA